MSTEKHHGVDYLARYLCKVPAYFTIPIAIALYFLLRAYSLPPSQLAHANLPGLEGMPQYELLPLFVAASIGKFVVPPLLIVPGFVWIVRYFKAQKLKQTTLAAASQDVMTNLSWEEFEKVTAQAFANRGYDAQLTSPGADGGVDLVIKKDGKTYFVQCKHWRANQVNADVVRSLYGVVQKYGAHGAFVVTSGAFTVTARDFAKDLPLWLITGGALRGLISQGQDAPGQKAGKLNLSPAALGPADEICQKCRSRMLLRTANNGANAGGQFWGCTQFPRCDGTRSI